MLRQRFREMPTPVDAKWRRSVYHVNAFTFDHVTEICPLVYFMRHFLVSLLVVSFISIGRADDELNCLTKDEQTRAALYAQLQLQAYAALDQRDEAYEQLKSLGQIRARQQELRAFFVKQLGGFPERTSLDARTVRTIEAEGYRIENVIFASQPNHHITANLYLPTAVNPDSVIGGCISVRFGYDSQPIQK